MADDITPTEDLALEVLAARHRLGESWWTFDSRHGPALRRLEDKGYVAVMHGIVERTVRARLTDAGRAECIDDSYTPPMLAAMLADAHEAGKREGAAEVAARVEALVEKWRYKGEFGWGSWQAGEGPDLEGQVLDECASDLRAALTPNGGN